MAAKRVLAIEDSPTLREVIRRVLGPVGFEVIEADSFEGALKAIEDQSPDLVIADCSAAGVELPALLRAARGGNGGSGVPVLVLSTGDVSEQAEGVIGSEGTDVLYRPFVPDWLISKARQLVS